MGFPRAALQDVIIACGDRTPATWEDRALGYQAGARVILTLASYGEVGWDETKDEWDEDVGAREVTDVGRRLALVNVRVDSYTPDVVPTDLAEKIRSRLYRETMIEACDAAGLAYLGSTPIVAAPWSVDGRQCLSAMMTLRFYHLSLDVQTDNPGGVIESFVIAEETVTP